MSPILGQPPARKGCERLLQDAFASLVQLAIQFPGTELARFFEKASCGSVGIEMHQAWAYSSVGLERTPDKREVGGSNPPRPTISDRGIVGL